MLVAFKLANHYMQEWDSTKFIWLLFRYLLRKQQEKNEPNKQTNKQKAS